MILVANPEVIRDYYQERHEIAEFKKRFEIADSVNIFVTADLNIIDIETIKIVNLSPDYMIRYWLVFHNLKH